MSFKRKIQTLPLKLRSLLRHGRVERELDDELQYHLDRQIEENIARGLTPREARYAALRAFGNTAATREHVRTITGWSSLETALQDTRYGFRLLRRSPAFALFAIASLSLGIGAAGAIFSLLNAIVLRDLPVRDPEQLVSLYITAPGMNSNWSLPYPQFEAMRSRNTTLDGLIALSVLGQVSVSDGGEPELSSADAVSGDYFNVLGLRPAAGRLLAPEDDKADSAIAILSYGYWQRRFGGNPSVIGSAILVNNKPFTVAGVAPPGFFGVIVGSSTDIMIPMRARDILEANKSPWDEAFSTWIYMMGRLKSGESRVRAEEQLDLIYRQVSADAARVSPPQSRSSSERMAREVHLKLDPASAGTLSGLRDGYRSALQLLLMMIGAVVVLASLNVGTLLLSRSEARQKEIATRLALGAGRRRVVRQLFTESVLLAAVAGTAGLFLTSWGSRALFRMAQPRASVGSDLPLDLSLDSRVVLFTMAVSVLTCLVFGLVPGLRATAPGRLNLAARETGLTRRRSSLDRVLVGSQVALSLVILIAAGLFARSLQSLWSRETGYDRSNVLMFSVDAGLAGKTAPEARAAYTRILAEVRNLPNVQSASMSAVRPVSDSFYFVDRVTQIADRALQDDQRIRVAFNWIAPGYFETLRVPLLAGRDFTDQDARAVPGAAIISETMARRHFANENPVGQLISLGRDRREIIGVAADTRYANIKDAPREVVYRPIFQSDFWFAVSFEIRYANGTDEIARQIRDVVRGAEPELALFNVKTLETQTAESLSRERLLAVLSSYFGGFTLLLVCIGLYGLLNYSIARRTPALGLRMALGARSSSVRWMVLRDSSITVLVGCAAGIIGSLGLTRLLQIPLFDITPHDPVVFAGATLFLLAMAFVASIVPAARASRIDPMVALKHE